MTSQDPVRSEPAFAKTGARSFEGSDALENRSHSSFRLLAKRFSKTLLTFYLMTVVAYAVLQPFVGQSILSYLKAVGIIEN
jgi:hypothetical protein